MGVLAFQDAHKVFLCAPYCLGVLVFNFFFKP